MFSKLAPFCVAQDSALVSMSINRSQQMRPACKPLTQSSSAHTMHDDYNAQRWCKHTLSSWPCNSKRQPLAHQDVDQSGAAGSCQAGADREQVGTSEPILSLQHKLNLSEVLQHCAVTSSNTAHKY